MPLRARGRFCKCRNLVACFPLPVFPARVTDTYRQFTFAERDVLGEGGRRFLLGPHGGSSRYLETVNILFDAVVAVVVVVMVSFDARSPYSAAEGRWQRQGGGAGGKERSKEKNRP